MKKLFLSLCVAVGTVQAQTAVQPSFDFNQVTVSQVVNLVYSEALKSNYVIAPEILADGRIVSFRYRGPETGLRPFVGNFLSSLGYAVETRSGVDYVTKTKEPEKVKPEEKVFIYRPHFRDASYLMRVTSGLFKGRFSTDRPIAPANPQGAITQNVPQNSAAGLIQHDADTVVFVGVQSEVDQLEKLLTQLDTPKGQVAVRAAVYEFNSSKADGSAFQAVLNLLNSKIGVHVNQGVTNLANSINLSFSGFQAVLSAVDSDSRFKSLSQPRLRVNSGELAKLTVGSDVPVLGSVSYQATGAAVQSVQYQSSGTILSITPTVRDAVIDMKVNQQLSNFVATNTGVNGSPTLIKRQLDTTISAQSGDVIILGGLSEQSDTNARGGLSFLPWNLSKQNSQSVVDVLVILQLEKV